jgi:putative endonuclease
MNWSVYMILCSDNSLYTGITTDVERRFQQHANQKGAKYFRSCQPLELVFVENGHNRSTASQREAQIKAMKRDEKLQMIKNQENH